jgi:hypothetical protein
MKAGPGGGSVLQGVNFSGVGADNESGIHPAVVLLSSDGSALCGLANS